MTSETKHTPGPWEVTNNTADGYGQLVVDSMHGAIAICYTAEPGDPGIPFECGANARLIAAAPELLDALQDLLNATEETYDNRHERQAALDAIAKATGEG